MANGGIIGPVNIPTSTTATGVWQQEEQYEARVTDTWPERSLFTTKSARFNDDSSDYLNRTPSSATNQKTFTISMWVKRGELGSANGLLLQGVNSGNNDFAIYFTSADKLQTFSWSGGSKQFQVDTQRVFRDVSAWYHILFVADTTQGTDSNRIKIYINGVQETALENVTYPSQNINLEYNDTSALWVGRSYGGNYFDGYMTEVISVDGTALTPTSFGVTNSDGVWTPIPYTGTFGNNGFNLQFENAAALGTDSSPNGNTFTVNNLTSIDQTTDYPVVNFATANSLNVNAGAVGIFTDGNLTIKVANSTGSVFGSSSTIGASSGKWYCEVKIITIDSTMIGVSPSPSEDARNNTSPSGANSSGAVGCLAETGTKYVSDSGTTYGAATSANGIMMIALDLDNLKVYFGSGGQWANGSGAWNQSGLTSGAAISITAVASTAEGAYFFGFGDGGGSAKGKVSWNFGNPPYAISSSNADGNGYGNFEYAVPSGYYALNTANLAEFG